MSTALLALAVAALVLAGALVVVAARSRRRQARIGAAIMGLQQRLDELSTALDEAEARRRRAREHERPPLESITAFERDSLTGLGGRRPFVDRLAAEVERARLLNATVALLVLDVDGFGELGARVGGLAADSVLAEIGGLVREAAPADDLGFRVGGDSFAVIVPGSGLPAAESAFARLQAHLRDRPEAGGVAITAGITALEAGDGALELLVRAEDALRFAKDVARGSAVVTSAAAAG
jgi:diguanylate cyclase